MLYQSCQNFKCMWAMPFSTHGTVAFRGVWLFCIFKFKKQMTNTW